MKIDPVCKMEVQEAGALTATCNGEVYYFCSHGCREKFMKAHPEGRRLYDLIIVGGGPAALTAAVYASTMKVNAFVIARDLGGQALDSSKIENYMGYDFVTGPELIDKFKGQLILRRRRRCRYRNGSSAVERAGRGRVSAKRCVLREYPGLRLCPKRRRRSDRRRELRATDRGEPA